MSDDFNYLVDDQDLRIIKNIFEDKSSANEFAKSFDETINFYNTLSKFPCKIFGNCINFLPRLWAFASIFI